MGCRVRARLSGGLNFLFDLVKASLEATQPCFLFSKARSEEKRCRTTPSYLGSAAIIQLKL